MESKGGKKKSSSSSSSLFYEVPLGYSIEDVRPNEGIKKFRSAAYSNMCMTGFNREKASVFYRSESGFAADMTINSGIRKILPDSEICDFKFDPCGYSMNSVEGPAISTIHVTPEDWFSYASFEAAGYDPKDLNMNRLVERVLACFNPNEFSIATHADLNSQTLEQNCSVDVNGYCRKGRSLEELGPSWSIAYQKFVNIGDCESPRSNLQSFWKEDELPYSEEE